MRKGITLLVVFAASVGLAGCLAQSQIPPCYDPGTQFSKSCFYRLTIKEDNKGMVTATVADEVLVQNSTRHFWQTDYLPWPFDRDFDVNMYDKAVFTFNAPDLPRGQDVKGKTFDFCSVPHSQELKLAPPQNPAKPEEDRCAQSSTQKPAQQM